MVYRYLFEDGVKKPAAEWERQGKPEWHNMLDISMDRYRALELISRLANALRDPAESRIELNLVGLLTENDDE